MASPTSVSFSAPAALPEGLCSQCAAFDLDDALCFKPAIPVRFVLEITQLKPKTCAFCKFLFGSMGHLTEGETYNLTAVQAHVAVTPLLEKIQAPVLCIEARREWQIFNFFDIRSFIMFDSCGPIARNLQPIAPMVDYRVVREWIDSCVQTHQCHRVDSGKDSQQPNYVRDLEVIDYDDRFIRYLLTTASYVTLSYVWGKPEGQSADQEARLESPAPNLLPRDLPATIEDAIRVTLALKYRYLWVDRYCLDKSSENFHVQLKQMGKIYAGSTLTIIAAAGSDGSYGLPGVSRQRIVNQPFHFGQRTLHSTPLFSRETLESTTWSSRGWTYQEGLLSKRRLVFTDTQLYYECQERSRMEGWLAPEDMFWRRDEESTGSWCDYFKTPDPGLFPTVNGDVKSVLSRIEAFTKRSLTYEDDVLNALLGIFALLREDKLFLGSGIQHIWGMPYFSYDVNFRRERTPLAISLSRFVNNLSWDVDAPVRRRFGFPSWSWTGWIGPVRWAKGLMLVDNGRYTRCRSTPDVPCTVSVELRNGKIIDWRMYHAMYDLYDTSEDAPNAQRLAQYIHISAYITKIIYSNSSGWHQLELDRERSNTDCRPVYISVRPTAEDHVSFGRGLHAIHLPWYLEYGHDSEFNVLVIRRHGTHWQRVGIGSTSTLLEAAPVKKTWTTIRLG